MKGNKIISRVAKILGIVLISLIAFVGIYVQKTNRMENIVKDYKYNMDLEGRRVISLKVSDGKETVIKDKDGNEVEEELTDEQITEKGYTKEETPDNNKEVLTEENYNKTKKIIEKRLDDLNVNNYIVRLNKDNGTIYIEIPEDTTTDHTISNISEMGKFEIVDDDNSDVLINNNQIKSAKVFYNTQSTGTTVYLNIEFNKEGKEKLSEISKTYVKTENTNTTEENTTEDGQAENNTTEKKIALKVDDNTMLTTSFGEPIENGSIQLSMGTASLEKKEIEDSAERAKTIATLLDNGKLPIKYEVDENKYVASDFTQEMVQKVVIALGAAIIVALIILSIKYKTKGLLASISFIGFIAICSLVVRYVNVIITLNSMVAMFIVLLLNYVFNIIMLNITKKENDINKTMKESYKEFFTKVIPVIILSIVFSFISWIPVSSFGMTLVWGLAIIAIYNILVTRNFVK